MESPEAVSSVFLPLPPEPPDPDLDVMLLVDHPVPPVPPHPPPILIDASVLSVQPLLMHPLLAEADLSSSLTTRRVSLLHPVSKPRNLVSCGEHVSFKSSLRNVPYYQQKAGVIEISVARFLGLLTADCKFTRHFKFLRTGLRMLKFWRCSQSKHILHLKPWSHVFGPISPCFMLSQGMVFISYWSESFLFDHCLREEFNYLSRRSLFPCKQEIKLFLNGSLPRIEDVISSSIFKFKLSLPQNEDVIWTSVFVAMYAIVSGLNIWPWWLASQQSIFWKRCLVASEFVDVSYPVGYVENFPTWSANGTWIVSSTQSTEAVTLQKAPHSTFSSGFSSLQILADSIVIFFALRLGLVLIEITGSFIVRNIVPLVIPRQNFAQIKDNDRICVTSRICIDNHFNPSFYITNPLFLLCNI
ncbi:hypothetical protein YC2023_116128 [Brassica napus]